MKPRLNGRWVSKSNSKKTCFVDKVYKAGHVLGFTYTDMGEKGTEIGKLKVTWEELEKEYMRVDSI